MNGAHGLVYLNWCWIEAFFDAHYYGSVVIGEKTGQQMIQVPEIAIHLTTRGAVFFNSILRCTGRLQEGENHRTLTFLRKTVHTETVAFWSHAHRIILVHKLQTKLNTSGRNA